MIAEMERLWQKRLDRETKAKQTVGEKVHPPSHSAVSFERDHDHPDQAIIKAQPSLEAQAAKKSRLRSIWSVCKRWLSWKSWRKWRNSHLGSKQVHAGVRVTWDKLLQRLFHRQIEIPTTFSDKTPLPQDMTAVYLDLRVRKWEYLPEDIIRPVASVPLGQLLILAQRLGLRWKVCKPLDGQLRAEDDGCSMTLSHAPNFGIIVRYSEFADSIATLSGNSDRLLIPSAHVDKMLCGIIPGEPALLGGGHEHY